MQELFQGWSAKKFETWGPTSTQAGKRAAPVTVARPGAKGLIREWEEARRSPWAPRVHRNLGVLDYVCVP